MPGVFPSLEVQIGILRALGSSMGSSGAKSQRESAPATATDDDESPLSEAATTPESTPSFRAGKAKPLPILCLDDRLDPGCLDLSLLSLQPATPATVGEWSMDNCAGSADAASHLEAVLVRTELQTAELRELTALRCVSERHRDECPVCFAPYDEGCYPSARAAGAFECDHTLCFGCSRKLLITAAGERRSLIFRCPLCRADGCLDRADVPTPAWLLNQLADVEVVSARDAATVREEEQAPIRLRLAASSAADQVAALHRLIAGDSAPAADIHRLLALLAARGAAEVPEEEAAVEEEVVEEGGGGGHGALEEEEGAAAGEDAGVDAGVTAARGDGAPRC